MLDLFNLKESNKIVRFKATKYKKASKHFPSPLREWKNSIYVYNKNSLNLIPCSTISTINIIKSYFNLFNKKIEAKMRTKRLLLRLRRISTNKYYISNGGFKHTNNKVTINLYVFNRQKTNNLLVLKEWYLNSFLEKTDVKEKNINVKLINRLQFINKKGIQAMKTLNKNKHLLIKALNSILKNNKFNINKFKDLSKYTESFYKRLMKKSLRKIKMYFYYKQLLYINKSKLNYTYLQHLKKYLEKIYNKNVEFNIINLKRFYLNSDILSETMATKISKNRKKIIRYLRSLKNKINVRNKSIFNSKPKKRLNNIFNFSQNTLLHNYIAHNLKYRHVTGFRFEVKGRLNRRSSASRSTKKIKYKGNLLDIDSSYKGLSTVLLKGNLKSNIQYSKLNSKTRAGSFGVRGWVSGN